MRHLLGLLLLASCGDDVCDPTRPGMVCTIAGNGLGGFDEGPATEVSLHNPVDVTVAPTGEVWIPDFHNYRIMVVGDDGVLRTVAGNGQGPGDSPPAGVASMPASEAALSHNTSLVFHEDAVYLAAWHNSRIKRIRLTDMMIENVGGRGTRLRYDGDGGPALDAAFSLPSAIAFDLDGNLTFMDQENQVIRQIDREGAVRTIAGVCVVGGLEPCASTEPLVACPGSAKLACGDVAACGSACQPAFGGDGGPATAARLGQPTGSGADPGGRLAYDRDGNLLLADTENHRIRKIDRAGIITTIAGSGGATNRGAYAGDGGPATEALLNHPTDIAVASDGTIYVADTYNSCIRAIDPGGTITRFAGQCSPDRADDGFAGDGGHRLDARFDRPFGIDLSGDLLYIADTRNSAIRVANTRDADD